MKRVTSYPEDTIVQVCVDTLYEYLALRLEAYTTSYLRARMTQVV